MIGDSEKTIRRSRKCVNEGFKNGMSIIVFLKKTAENLILRIAKPSIVFESIPDFSDNTRAVFDEMVRRGFDRKYRLVWFISWDQCATLSNGTISYWNPHDRKGLRKLIRHYSLFRKTRCLICCNRYLPSKGHGRWTKGKNQLAFYLTHGTPIKKLQSFYSEKDGADYVLSAAECLNEIISREFSVNKDQIFAAGFPRNDQLTNSKIDLHAHFGNRYKKIIIWFPTYRQHANGNVITHGDSMPLIHDRENAEKLNEIAEKNGVLIVLKPHFAQDTSLIHEINASNILVIDDKFFSDAGFSSYEMLAASDALITDYSSVYFDYTLCDKPVCFVWEDIDDYKKNRGFAEGIEEYLNGAERVYSIDELCAFLKRVADGEDRLQEARRLIRDRVNYSSDGRNAERVVDFIAEKAGLSS